MKYIMFPHYIRIDNRRIKTYAIVARKKCIVEKIVKDVSTDRIAVRDLVKRLNAGKVELIHLGNIIEDFYCKW